MEIHRVPLIGLVLVLAGLAFASYQPSAAAAANSTAVQQRHSKAAPKSITKAASLARLAATQLVTNYAKGRANSVCNGLTAKTRKLLGGASGCASRVRGVRSATPISKVKVTKIAFRSARTWATMSGYLNGNRRQRLSVVFKWESGRYRLDHSVSVLSGLLG